MYVRRPSENCSELLLLLLVVVVAVASRLLWQPRCRWRAVISRAEYAWFGTRDEI